MITKKILLSILIFILVLVVGGGVAVAILLPADGCIARGVLVAGTEVGGLTKQAAEGKIAPVLEARLASKIHWRYEERSWHYTLGELGMAFDLHGALDDAMKIGRQQEMLARVGTVLRAATHPIRIEPALVLTRQAAGEALSRLAQQVRREPTDAYLTLNGEDVVVHPQKSGTELDVEAVVSQLEEIAVAGSSRDYLLPVKLEEPKVTTADLEGFDCVLGGFSTSFSGSSRDRGHNIAVAAEALNGTLIGPKGTFSFNDVVGPRSTETGYKTAPIYQGGKVVPGIGGGVCQVSSTTYNAFLLAGFDIISRSNHAMPVHYLPAGRDATVVYGAIDLKVRSPFPNTAYLMAGVSGNTLWVKVLGRKTDKMEVSVSSKVTGDIPFSIIEKEDPSLAPGKKKVDQKGANGRTSITYRKISRPGEPEKVEVVSRDSYRPMNKIILIAPKPSPGKEVLPEKEETVPLESEPLPSEPEGQKAP